MSKNSKIVASVRTAQLWKDEGTKHPIGSGYSRSPDDALQRIRPKNISEKKFRRWQRVAKGE